MHTVDIHGLRELVAALLRRGFRILGPSARDGAVGLEEISSLEELPSGLVDTQEPGSYRLAPHDDGTLFGPTLGPQSWKRFLFPAELRLWTARREEAPGGIHFRSEPDAAPRPAFFGLRPCDLAALRVLDRVFLDGPFPDPVYRRRRDGVFLVVAQCTRSAGTCFCASLHTGPHAAAGFDLAATEIAAGGARSFVFEAGSPAGEELLAEIPHRETTAAELTAVREAERHARGQQGRHLDTANLPERLRAAHDHPHWEETARRCLACGNCTLVCPTCFCSTVTDATDLAGRSAERRRSWDSCFTVEHSYLHGGSVRASVKSRYRQWLTHKLGTWSAQFGTTGCVGCGRCITWCPVGIDLIEEARAVTTAPTPPESRLQESPRS